MIRGLYNGAAALDVLARKHEIISSNVAHLNSAGHRRVDIAISQRPNAPDEGTTHELGPQAEKERIDFTQGIHHKTDRSMDTAIQGDAFYALEGDEGNLYTRDGRFYRSQETGILVSEEGRTVIGVDGPIQIDASVGDSELSISEDGTVSANGILFGKIQLVSFKDNQSLIPISQSIFVEGPQTEFARTQASVNQFHQEQSNTHPVTELVALIVGSRQYEAMEKSTRAISDALEQHIRS